MTNEASYLVSLFRAGGEVSAGEHAAVEAERRVVCRADAGLYDVHRRHGRAPAGAAATDAVHRQHRSVQLCRQLAH